ncbi:adenosylcobinamide-GDP ribazoletransferase [Malaciobacter marinus]|jgi:adenosylcobinamide-GDP ribazoletransferase|uniref:adenosylcobinamide-GDP ribazoletransferase n=1 Tax=Malaciobacter marinus TaxID=505249 RepID=UPI0009A6E6AF|nr:adenosylcobinamide-GDP ribazoletransferase [Malaciobacter marinus]SKB51735.1 cobalamin-5'-phosphate synthase [Malaciobacter marinus]
MREIFNAFAFSLSYFTVFPVFVKEMTIDKNTFKYTLFFLPVIGSLIAIVTILVFMFLSGFFHPLYASVVSAVISFALYGYLHTEAITDVVDAWFASYSGKDAYKIMKESTIGAIGAIATFSFVLLKVSIIAYLLYEKKYEIILIVFMFSRLSLTYILPFFKFNKDSFMSQAFEAKGVNKIRFAVLIFLVFAICLKISAILLFVLALLFLYLNLKILNKRFGFVNGDCLGCSIEITELLLLNIGFFL